jgi:hypothetical protein
MQKLGFFNFGILRLQILEHSMFVELLGLVVFLVFVGAFRVFLYILERL